MISIHLSDMNRCCDCCCNCAPITSGISGCSLSPTLTTFPIPHSGMEQVWVKEFNTLFSSYLPHLWYIQPVESKPIGGSSLTTFVDSAKVRFCCDVCGHGWTSMKGRVAFWFDLFYMYGIVAFKLYGQQCDRCKADRYEQPMWYPEEVAKVRVFPMFRPLIRAIDTRSPCARAAIELLCDTTILSFDLGTHQRLQQDRANLLWLLLSTNREDTSSGKATNTTQCGPLSGVSGWPVRRPQMRAGPSSCLSLPSSSSIPLSLLVSLERCWHYANTDEARNMSRDERGCSGMGSDVCMRWIDRLPPGIACQRLTIVIPRL